MRAGWCKRARIKMTGTHRNLTAMNIHSSRFLSTRYSSGVPLRTGRMRESKNTLKFIAAPPVVSDDYIIITCPFRVMGPRALFYRYFLNYHNKNSTEVYDETGKPDLLLLWQ
jgi:hypothetical protein